MWRFFASLATGAAFLAIFLFLSEDLFLRPAEFIRQGRAVEGRVVELQPHEHQAVVYSYRVGAHTYSGVGQPGKGTPAFGRLSVGDPVAVVYLPDRPDQSILGDPANAARGNVFYLIAGGMLGFVLATYSTFRWLSRGGSRRLEELSPRGAGR